MSPMTHGQRRDAGETDKAVLAALGHEALYMRDIRKNMKARTNISEPTIFRSLGRLVASGKAIREDRAKPEKTCGRRKTSYKGHGPEPTVFWRRV